MLLDIEIPGLDLVLGGGIRLLQRVDGAAESATLLIRGPAGSGKTILGTQLAASIARKLRTDVAYGCVELLPVELRAQHESIRSTAIKEEVIPLGKGTDAAEPDASFVRIYAGLLDIGETGQAVEHLGASLEALLHAAESRAGRPVRVIVVDSLSDGYGLGASAPRLLADGISKLAAASGLVVILIEESSDVRPSVWSFAVDTVLELGLAEENGRFQRRLRVPKNRLGPSFPGPHQLVIAEKRGVEISPAAEAYRGPLVMRRLGILAASASLTQSWTINGLDELKWMPSFRTSVTAVTGRNATAVRKLALVVGSKELPRESGKSLGQELFFRLGRYGTNRSTVALKTAKRSRYGLSFTETGAGFLGMLRRLLSKQNLRGLSPRRVIIGDLRDLRYHVDSQGMLAAISTAASLLRDLRTPLVLFETTESLNAGAVALSIADIALTYEDTALQKRLRVENLLGTAFHNVNGDLAELTTDKAVVNGNLKS